MSTLNLYLISQTSGGYYYYSIHLLIKLRSTIMKIYSPKHSQINEESLSFPERKFLYSYSVRKTKHFHQPSYVSVRENQNDRKSITVIWRLMWDFQWIVSWVQWINITEFCKIVSFLISLLFCWQGLPEIYNIYFYSFAWNVNFLYHKLLLSSRLTKDNSWVVSCIRLSSDRWQSGNHWLFLPSVPFSHFKQNE